MVKKIFLQKNVLEATYKRFDYIFKEFDNIYLSFSGGKDSGLMLNILLKYMKENNITKKIGVFHQDFEAQYTATTNYVEDTLTSNLDMITPYWCCMPLKSKTATSMYEQYWTPWETSKKDIWVRPMPKFEGVINIENHNFDFYNPNLSQEDFYKKFANWYYEDICKSKGKTICLVGIRTQESLNRWTAVSESVNTYKKNNWIIENSKNVCSAYPIYDWQTEDIWIANSKFNFDYNKIYDTFYHVGLTIHQMRVASPFNDWAIDSLKMYRAIEPDIWGAMVGRVNGANFCSIYGGTKAVAWKNIEKPKEHTWKSYVEFLLKTLPTNTRETYEEKFKTSIEFWRKKGGVLSEDTIKDLEKLNLTFERNGKSNFNSDKEKITFIEYPDDAKLKEFSLVPSYKRMAVCILKNDHLCKYMGFAPTKIENEKRKKAMAKYADL